MKVDKSISVNNFQINKIPFYITEQKIELENEKIIEIYSNNMKGTFKERVDQIISAIGINPEKISLYHKLILIAQLLPFIVDNYNLYLVGASETSKSTTYYAYNNTAKRYSGLPTSAELRGSKKEKTTPLLNSSILVLEEAADDKIVSDSMPIFKEYLESGYFFEENIKEQKSSCSLVYIGNNSHEISEFSNLGENYIFESLPRSLQDTAFLERFNAKIFKNEMFKISPSLLLTSQTNALNINLIFKYFEISKEIDYTVPLNFCDLSSRDFYRIRASMSGFLKMLYPNNDTPTEVIKGVRAFSAHLRFNGLKKHFLNPFNNSCIPFILEGIGIDVKDVERVILKNNRILIRKNNSQFYEKIALNDWGIRENQAEINFFKNYKNTILATIDLTQSSPLKIIQEYHNFYSTTCSFTADGNLIQQQKKNYTENLEYNKLLIRQIKEAAILNTEFPKEPLKVWKKLSELELIKILQEHLNINITQLSKSDYYYDDNDNFKLINFFKYIKK